jgi:hypothetical protein
MVCSWLSTAEPRRSDPWRQQLPARPQEPPAPTEGAGGATRTGGPRPAAVLRCGRAGSAARRAQPRGRRSPARRPGRLRCDGRRPHRPPGPARCAGRAAGPEPTSCRKRPDRTRNPGVRAFAPEPPKVDVSQIQARPRYGAHRSAQCGLTAVDDGIPTTRAVAGPCTSYPQPPAGSCTTVENLYDRGGHGFTARSRPVPPGGVHDPYDLSTDRPRKTDPRKIGRFCLFSAWRPRSGHLAVGRMCRPESI